MFIVLWHNYLCAIHGHIYELPFCSTADYGTIRCWILMIMSITLTVPCSEIDCDNKDSTPVSLENVCPFACGFVWHK